MRRFTTPQPVCKSPRPGLDKAYSRRVFAASSRLLLVALIAFFAGTAAHAQTVLQGTVTDRNTANPIAGVAVSNCTSCGTLATTDANGNYSLTAAELRNSSSGILFFQGRGYYANSSTYTITASPTTLNATLLPGGTVVQGAVTDASTQASIAGASVFLEFNSNLGFPSGNTVSATTGSGGQYTMDSSSFYEAAATGFDVTTVSLSASGYFNTQAGGFHVGTPFPFTQNFQMVVASGVVLQGTVTDRNTANPIAGVAVSNCTSCGTLATTDANGNYSLTAAELRNSSSGILFFQGRGYYANSSTYTITASPTTLNATLLPGGTVVQGAVTDASTQASIAGASVFLEFNSNLGFPSGNTVSATTGSGGQYTMDSSSFYEAAATGFDVTTVSLSASGYFNTQAGGFHVGTPFPFTQNFQMVVASGVVLQGTVTDRNTANPIAGVAVSNCTSCGTLATTDANGNYSLTAAELRNSSSGILFFQGRGYYANSSTYTITASPTTLNATLLPGGTVVQGAVTDASTQASIAGASVFLEFNSNLGFPSGNTVSATTGSGGQYTMDSSSFYEAAATGFDVTTVSLSASGYFNTQAGGFHVGTPFPFTQNFQMSSSGVLRNITIATNPAGLAISVDSTAHIAPQIFQWNPSNEHTIATTTPQAATAGTQYAFSTWSDRGALSHTIVVPDADTTYTASFKTQYTLTTAASPTAGGSITPGGWFDAGTSVTITATPNSGYQFTGFSGDLSGTTNPQNLTMNGPKSVTANFFAGSVATTTALVSSLNPSSSGQNVTFTATVTPAAQSGGTPTGTVMFKKGTTPLGTGTLVNGSASFPTSTLALGSTTVTAVYGGDTNFLGSTSNSVTQVVKKITTTTKVSSGLNPSFVGQSVTFTATLTSSFGPAPPDGETVSFKAGATALGTATLSSGTASVSTSTLAAGSFTITASYGGDTKYLSSSGILSQKVNKYATTTTVSAAPNPSTYGQSVMFTATVNSSQGPPLDGETVTFKSGATVLGTGTLSGGTASFTTAALSVGSKTITAVYVGDANFGTSSGTVTQKVNKAATTTTLTSGPNPSSVGQKVTFTATVSSSGGTPTGTVAFKQGATTLGTGTLDPTGTATFSTSTLTAGSHTVTATYNGSTNFANSTSAAVTQVVQ